MCSAPICFEGHFPPSTGPSPTNKGVKTIIVTLMQHSPKDQWPSWIQAPSKGDEVDVMHLSQVPQVLPACSHLGEKPREKPLRLPIHEKHLGRTIMGQVFAYGQGM